jgi:DNA-binding MarR family transcriptional regulator
LTVLFHAIVAERLGLGPTDHKALSLLERHGPLTAGTLATITGLTTGAVTGVVDRLERGGYVQRMPDAQDRRKVVIAVRSTPARDAVFAEVFGPLQAAMADVCAGYSDADLAVIHGFMRAGIDVLQQQIARFGGSTAARDST